MTSSPSAPHLNRPEPKPRRPNGRPRTFTHAEYQADRELHPNSTIQSRTNRLNARLAEVTLGLHVKRVAPENRHFDWIRGRQRALTALGLVARQGGDFACRVIAGHLIEEVERLNDKLNTRQAEHFVRVIWVTAGQDLVRQAQQKEDQRRDAKLMDMQSRIDAFHAKYR